MSPPIIAIVGRPNVGKSTLFNRLIRRRQAIVYEQPGTTRDRIYGEVEWEGKTLTVIDTGGLETAPVHQISRRIRYQVELAIEESDGIIFVVDVVHGLSPEDEDIADILRRCGKPVFLAVNKVDSPKREADAAVFHRLGLGEPLPISAYHGHGVEELTRRIFGTFPQAEKHEPPVDVMKIAIVGRPNVGKSTLLNVLAGKERAIVESIPGTTRDVVDELINTPEGPVLLIDMAGIRRRGHIEQGIEKYSVLRAFDAINRSDVVLLLIDGVEGLTAQDEHIAGYALESYKGLLVIINKSDLINKNEEMELTRTMSRRLKFLPESPLLFISALHRDGIDKISPKAKEIYQERKKVIPSEELNKVFNRALEVNPPSGKGTRRLAILSIRQSGTEPPQFTIEVNDLELIHFSYKRYLENALRQSFGFEGTAIRLLFEKRIRKTNRKKKAASAI